MVAEALESRTLLATVPAGFGETELMSGLSSPTSMAITPDGRVFIGQQNGVIRLVKNNAPVATPVLNLTVDSSGERGLMGFAFDPELASNPYLYVYYTATNPISHGRVSRFTLNGDVVVPNSEQVLIDLPAAGTAIWHMGGGVHFGPDLKLYVGVGDHQDPLTAQSLQSPFGKILRLNPDGTIPTDNPFFNQTTGVNRAIWARGLRNPYTSAFQPGTGLYYINDVGEAGWEEVNLGAAGANYGWPMTEGDFNQSAFPNFTRPVHAYQHGTDCAITGGAFYNPATPTFPPQYQGKYFFVDFCAGWIKTLDPATKQVANFASGAQFPNDMRVAPNGSIYYLTRGQDTGGQPTTGKLYRISFTSANASPWITTQPSAQTVATGEPVTFTVAAAGPGTLSYQWRRNNADIAGATSSSFTINSAAISDNGDVFTVRISNLNGGTISNGAALTVVAGSRPTATINLPLNGATYRAGDTIQYSATAFDADEGALGGGAFTWWVDLFHDAHSHPFVAPVTGASGGSFVVPVLGETDPDVFYRIHLSVKDSTGLTFVTSRDITPRKATITLNTNVPGLTLSLDGQPRTLPFSGLGVVGMTRLLTAPPQQVVNGVTYTFVSWSDGGAASHTIAFPDANTQYVATYSTSQTVYVSDLNHISATNGWGPYERDRSNGETGASDGGPIRLNGVTYAKGIGAHAASNIAYNLNGQYTRFTAFVGIDDEVGNNGNVIFRVLTDNNIELYNSGAMTGASATKTVDVDVTGRQTLRLIVDTNGNDYDDHADWADAKLVGQGTTPPPPPPTTGLFMPPASFIAGTHAHGIAHGDFNNDGKLDLAVANAGSANLSVLFGNGDGTFGPRTNYGVGSEPKSVVARDLNNDGRLDLITANQGSGTISVLINNGNGTFANAASYASPAGSHEAFAGDLNGDGRPDIAVVGWGASVVRILINNGNGTFANGVNYNVGSEPHSVIGADIDGDGDLDLAVANYASGNVALLRNNGNGTFQSATYIASGGGPHSIRAADFNGDGRIDLATANDGSDNVSVFLGNGNGTFATAVNYAVGRDPKGIAIGDIDNDGKLDIVTANSGGNYPTGNSDDGKKISVLRGNGNGTFGVATHFATGHTPFAVTLADFDGDGDLDAATANWHSNDTTLLKNTTVGGAPPPPNVAPVANDDFATTSAGVATQINVVSNDTDTDGTINPSTVTIITQPTNGSASVNPTTGVITYTPAPGFSGADAIFYNVKDNAGATSNVAKVTITVNPPAPNNPPVANDDTASTSAGMAVVIDVLANDSDSDGTLVPSSVVITTAPTNGATSVNATNGRITYTPVAGFTGIDTFFYTVKDNVGATSNAAKVTVNVTAAPPPPSIVYLSDLNPTTATNGWGPYERDRSNGEQGAADGGTITLNGITYAKGLGVHASSNLIYNLNGQYTRFQAFVGIDDEVGNAGSAIFQVFLDNVQVFATAALTGASATVPIDLNVSGKNQLRLVMLTNGSDDSDHGDWADAKLTVGTPVPDTQPPTAPTNLRSPGKTTTTISLAWDASTDNVGVAGYDVYRNGVKVGTTSSLAFTDTGLSPNTTYAYTVRAFDAVPNTSVASATLNVTTNAPGSLVYLSDLNPTSATNGWGAYERDRSNGEQGASDGGTLTLNGVTYAKGLGVHAASDIRYNLGGAYSTFQSAIGIDDEVGNSGNVIFRVYADGALIYDSGAMTGASATKLLNLSVAGVSELRLVVDSNGNNFDDHADWADAKLS